MRRSHRPRATQLPYTKLLLTDVQRLARFGKVLWRVIEMLMREVPGTPVDRERLACALRAVSINLRLTTYHILEHADRVDRRTMHG